MISLGRRVFLLSVGAVAVVAVLAVSLTGLRRTVEADVQANRAVVSAKRLWEHSLEQEADEVRGAVVDAVGDGGGAVPAADTSVGQALVQMGRRGVRSITFYDEIGQPSLSWPSAAGARAAPVDARRISQLVSGGEPFQVIGASGGTVEVAVGGTFPHPTAARAGFVATASLDRLLADVTQSGDASAFILDRKGAVLARNGLLPWAAVRDAFAARRGNVSEFQADGQAIELVVMPLSESASGLAGSVVLARDITVDRRLLDAVDTLSAAFLAIVSLVIVFSLQWALGRLIGPLTTAIGAMSALADGDTGVEVLGDQRKDETGRMARSIKVFRDRMRASRNTEERRVRQWHRQQDFVRGQMLQLAGTLSEEGRVAFFADLDRIESADRGAAAGDGARSLGVALEVMTERVRDQHRRLDGLVVELQGALDQKTELMQLQEQVAIAHRIQETMLPRGIAPGARFQAAARMVAAQAFDGAFYDYAMLPDQRVGLLVGQPAGGGLAAAFVAATARASLKALLSAGLAPADALGRTAALLAGDADAAGLALAAAVFDPQERRFDWASAGIDPPLVVRRLGDVVETPFERGAALATGGGEAAGVAEGVFALPPRAAVVIVSPGLLEAGGGFVSRGRLAEVLREAADLSPDGLLAALRAEGVFSERMGGDRDRFCVVLRAKD